MRDAVTASVVLEPGGGAIHDQQHAGVHAVTIATVVAAVDVLVGYAHGQVVIAVVIEIAGRQCVCHLVFGFFISGNIALVDVAGIPCQTVVGAVNDVDQTRIITTGKIFLGCGHGQVGVTVSIEVAGSQRIHATVRQLPRELRSGERGRSGHPIRPMHCRPDPVRIHLS